MVFKAHEKQTRTDSIFTRMPSRLYFVSITFVSLLFVPNISNPHASTTVHTNLSRLNFYTEVDKKDRFSICDEAWAPLAMPSILALICSSKMKSGEIAWALSCEVSSQPLLTVRILEDCQAFLWAHTFLATLDSSLFQILKLPIQFPLLSTILHTWHWLWMASCILVSPVFRLSGFIFSQFQGD